jgi:hypothetical protein
VRETDTGARRAGASDTSGLTVAIDQLLVPKVRGKQGGVIIVTNGKSAFDGSDEDERALVDNIEQALASNNLTLTVFGIDFMLSDNKDDLPQSEAMLRRLALASGGEVKVICSNASLAAGAQAASPVISHASSASVLLKDHKGNPTAIYLPNADGAHRACPAACRSAGCKSLLSSSL